MIIIILDVLQKVPEGAPYPFPRFPTAISLLSVVWAEVPWVAARATHSSS